MQHRQAGDEPATTTKKRETPHGVSRIHTNLINTGQSFKDFSAHMFAR
jgi:hypothetical protein